MLYLFDKDTEKTFCKGQKSWDPAPVVAPDCFFVEKYKIFLSFFVILH